MAASAKLFSSVVLPTNLSPKSESLDKRMISYDFRFSRGDPVAKLRVVPPNGSASSSAASQGAESRAVGEMHRQRSSLESLLCYDKPVPEEKIENPIGLALSERVIGDNTPCNDCQAKGVVLCATCSGSGLYVDSILESQGIIVKVRCLGCGGTGNIMCSECGGRGHLGTS